MGSVVRDNTSFNNILVIPEGESPITVVQPVNRVVISEVGIINTNNISSSYAQSASYAHSSSYASVAQTLLGSVESASYALVAQTLLGSVQSASYALSASYAPSNPPTIGSQEIGFGASGSGLITSSKNIKYSGSSLLFTGSLAISGTILVGTYQAPSLYTTEKITLTNSGSFYVYGVSTSSYDAIWFEYIIRSSSNARAGQIMAVWSGSETKYTETTTTDFGNTTGLSFGVFISSSQLTLTGSATSGSWVIKTIIRSI